jgi:hypothetical protein
MSTKEQGWKKVCNVTFLCTQSVTFSIVALTNPYICRKQAAMEKQAAEQEASPSQPKKQKVQKKKGTPKKKATPKKKKLKKAAADPPAAVVSSLRRLVYEN